MAGSLIFVESNTSGTGMLALQQAKGWGLNPVFLTKNPDLYSNLADLQVQTIICNTDSVTELLITVQQEVDDIIGVVSTSDYYLGVVSHLSGLMGLPGNPAVAVETCRDKFLTREKLSHAAIKQPLYCLIESTSAIELAVRSIGLPCVVKPTDESGSKDVTLCNSLADVVECATKILSSKINARGQLRSRKVLLEQYIDGPEYSVEMFTWEGRSYLIGITEKTVTSQEFVEVRHIFPANIREGIADEICGTVERVIDSVGVTTGATHTEVKVVAGQCVVLEINIRLAGGMIPELIRLSTKLDILKEHIHSFTAIGPNVGLFEDVKYENFAGIQFITADKPGILREVCGLEEVRSFPFVSTINISSCSGTQIKVAKDASDRLGYIVVQGDTYQETLEQLQSVSDNIYCAVEDEAND